MRVKIKSDTKLELQSENYAENVWLEQFMMIVGSSDILLTWKKYEEYPEDESEEYYMNNGYR